MDGKRYVRASAIWSSSIEANNWAFFTKRLLACAMLTACPSVSTADSDRAESCAKAETLVPIRRQNRSGRIIETVLSQIQSGGASQTECAAVHTHGLGRDYTLSPFINALTGQVTTPLTSARQMPD